MGIGADLQHKLDFLAGRNQHELLLHELPRLDKLAIHL